jgi:AcrR family transcriptional regulator
VARAVNPRRHAARRDEFIDAAQALIQSKGYEQLSVEDVLAETGSSKGAFYHYFDSKSALLSAVVDRMVNAGVDVVAGVVADPDLSAVEKLQGYFRTLAAFKGERHDFLVKVIDVWYSDDNAIVRERFRREAVRLVTPHFASIIRQGIAEGTFSLTQPDEMARVVLALMMDTGDEAGQLYLARHAGRIGLEDVRRRLATYEAAIERLLGLAPASLHLIEEHTLETWFDAPSSTSKNPPRWTTDPPDRVANPSTTTR